MNKVLCSLKHNLRSENWNRSFYACLVCFPIPCGCFLQVCFIDIIKIVLDMRSNLSLLIRCLNRFLRSSASASGAVPVSLRRLITPSDNFCHHLCVVQLAAYPISIIFCPGFSRSSKSRLSSVGSLLDLVFSPSSFSLFGCTFICS